MPRTAAIQYCYSVVEDTSHDPSLIGTTDSCSFKAHYTLRLTLSPHRRQTMSDGCFSWCPLLRRWGAKKQSPEIEVSIDPCCAISLTQSYHQGHQLAIVGVAAPVPIAKIVMEPESDKVTGLILVLWTLTNICIQTLSENPHAVVPTTTQYFMATGKQA